MNNEPIQAAETNKPKENKKSPVLALTLGFLPAAILLILRFVGFVVKPTDASVFLFFALVCSVTCGFSSTILLFRHKTWLSVCGGILLFILNAAISCFLFIAWVFSGQRGC